MTPLQIEILLHYYTRANDYRDGDFSAPAVLEAINNFIGDDLLRDGSRASAQYELSERGRVFIEALQSTPLPVRKWVMP